MRRYILIIMAIAALVITIWSGLTNQVYSACTAAVVAAVFVTGQVVIEEIKK